MPKFKTQFPFKGKSGHISKVNVTNMAYPNEYIDIKTIHGSKEPAVLADTV